MQRVVSDIGWVRSDVVEHCARVLRLRVVSAMHRARVDLFKHRDAPGPLVIPPRGPRQTTNPQIEEEKEEGKSRLDILRLEITGRILRQDALWAGNSPYISLPQPTRQSMQHPEWLIPGILPAGGLQCIIKVPATQTTPASVSSESTARDIWKTLAKTQPHEPPDIDILDQSGASWMSYVIASPPKAQCEPTLSIHALEYLYHCLPALTLDTLSVVNGGRVMSKRQARKLREKSHGNMDPVVAPVSEVTAYASKLRSQAIITYRYTLGRSGHEFAVAQGDAVTKTVPVYYADEIFGPDVSATVINWLLSHTSPKQAPEADGTLSSHYIGVVALPCTADLATQLHRLTVFAEN
ncbi:hypothetical protein GGF37_000810 [Kickxella alabastrina]|nr:hypothetical protein GGF37_000810 [Kickxella alabastrina]